MIKPIKRVGERPMAYLCNDNKIRTVAELADIVGIARPTMRQRLLTWGISHPDIMRPGSPKSAKRTIITEPIKVDLIEGDLEGKYTGRTTVKERREALKKIPEPTFFDKYLNGIP